MNRPITFRTQFLMNGITLVLVALLVLVSNTFANPGLAAITTSTPTTTISYQGNLTDSDGQPINETVPMTFKLYPAPTGGTPIWTEARTGANAVPVTDGLFTVLLGSVTPIDVNLFQQQGLWLGISVNGDAEMTPRERLNGGATAVVPRLLGEKTCDDLKYVKETLPRGAHVVKCTSPQDKLEVTVNTNGRPILVHTTARYYMSPAQETYCAIEVLQNGTRVEVVDLDGTGTATGSHGCSGSYLFTNLPAGTYTFQSMGGVWETGDDKQVTWKHNRQIAVFEY